MIVRRKDGAYSVQMVTEGRNSKIAITIADQRFEMPKNLAEDMAAAIQETVYEHNSV